MGYSQATLVARAGLAPVLVPSLSKDATLGEASQILIHDEVGWNQALLDRVNR